MPTSFSPADATLEALGYALFVSEGDTLRLASKPPGWLRGIWPQVKTAGAKLPVADASPFLENFLIDAAECWEIGGDRRARSGPWVEEDSSGDQLQIEAVALTVKGQKVLLIERLGEDFDSRKAVLQKARESVVSYHRLSAEMQKKEILLHYLAEDMNSSLGNIITSLRLVELEQNPLRMRKLLDLAGQAARQQQSLIHRILGSFSDELDNLYGQGSSRADADVFAAVHLAAEAAVPQFADKRVTLDTPTDHSSSSLASLDEVLRAAIDPVRLERVIANLLENALHTTPSGGRVSVRIADKGSDVLIHIEDGGPPIPEDMRDQLFGVLEPLPAPTPSTELRLHYCRMAIENSEGEIGCHPGEAGGNAFWIRLPKFPSSR